MKTIVFVSQKTDLARLNPHHIRDICDVAQARNATLQLTGALVSTPDRFAQLLEGPIGSVDAVMASILRDLRHTDIRIVRDAPLHKRSLAAWGLAYVGVSTYVQGLVAPLLTDNLAALDTDRLVRLMQEFAR